MATERREVVVLEAADRVGGRIRSEPRGDNWLDFGAHVFGGEGSMTGAPNRMPPSRHVDGPRGRE